MDLLASSPALALPGRCREAVRPRKKRAAAIMTRCLNRIENIARLRSLRHVAALQPRLDQLRRHLGQLLERGRVRAPLRPRAQGLQLA